MFIIQYLASLFDWSQNWWEQYCVCRLRVTPWLFKGENQLT